MTVLDDAPVAERSRKTSGTATAPSRPTRSRAAQRAIDRRQRRIDRDGGARSSRSTKGAVAQPSSLGMRARVASVPFVVPVLALLVAGLALSLLLSTKAAQDSYRLGVERAENQSLMDRRDSLKRDFESGDSAPELSDKASKLGMIPARDPARMIVGANGKARVVGDPAPAQGKPMGTINPSDQPDPLAKIDKYKVDDSTGLPGTSDSGAANQPSGSADDSAGGGADSAVGSGAAAGAGAARPTAPAPAPAPAPTAPLNPNVLPPNNAGGSNANPSAVNGNPPSANSR